MYVQGDGSDGSNADAGADVKKAWGKPETVGNFLPQSVRDLPFCLDRDRDRDRVGRDQCRQKEKESNIIINLHMC